MFDVNLLSVFIAGLSAFLFGWLWYSNILFGKRWQSLMGYTPENMAEMKMGAVQAMLGGFITTLISSYVLAHFLDLGFVLTYMDASTFAFWAWLGFSFPITLGALWWENRPFALVLINLGHTLGSLVVMALVLTYLY